MHWNWDTNGLLDKTAKIKAGIMGTTLTGFVAVVQDLPWLAILSVIAAAINIIGVIHKIWLDRQENRRREVLFKLKVRERNGIGKDE